jgi:tRNA threonylcarbamoyladenosine biosynthesis protein TsaB
VAILALETSTKVCGVAIVSAADDSVVLFERDVVADRTHSRVLLPMIDEALRVSGIAGRELSAIAVSAGPGSFTGLRIGLATAKGLGMAWELPVIAVGSLEVIAMRASASALACPVMDARRGMYYSGLYARSDDEVRELKAPGAYSIADIAAFIECHRGVELLGDSAALLADSGHHIVPGEGWLPRARDLGSLARARLLAGRIIAADEVVPVYLRNSAVSVPGR